MTHDSAPGVLVLHAVRILGFADTPAIIRRFELDQAETDAALQAAEARGWVQYTAFAGSGGWSLTESGQAENERRLAAELVAVGGTNEVRDVYRQFLPFNTLLQQACTDWQLRPTSNDPLATNDHSDPIWDSGVLHELVVIGRGMTSLTDRLTSVLARFGGYDRRFATALGRVRAGQTAWVDHTDVDSCHRVWFELHEDLLATLGLHRGPERDGVRSR